MDYTIMKCGNLKVDFENLEDKVLDVHVERSDIVSSLKRPVKELKAFKKVKLSANEKKDISNR